jgi:RND family efflux transporter MFP subunit
MPVNPGIYNWIIVKRGWRWLALLAVVLCGLYVLSARGRSADPGVTFVARRGALDISVLEGGSIESEEKGEIKCEVKGGQGVKILKIVEEGYQVTEEDVRDKLVLVELDSAELRDRITQQEITFESTVASLTEAQQAYEIQLNQNLSDIMAAIQKARFSRMDFEKYMGDQAASEIISQLGLATELNTDPHLQIDETNHAPSATTDAGPGSSPATNGPEPRSPGRAVDFVRYADIAALGDGEAKQKLREFQDTLLVAQKEQQQAQATLEGTERLLTKGFVTRTELDRDQLAFENNALKVKKAETALGLFEKYEFPKAAEENLSKYTEALRELDRTRKGALSKMAQASAKLKSAQARHSLEESQLKELRSQLEKCSIQAPRPGLVVYGDGSETRYWRGEEQIREGATVREQQTVITVPDMSRICIKVKIHESYIKRIKKGQPARITVDAFPDRSIQGEVSQVAVLPDSENAWLNPDMKVYRTTVTIQGEHDWIRPGMSAKVQIQVDQLPDVVFVPLQAVSTLKTKKVCYVLHDGSLEMREVQVGQFNDEFIEIQDGLAEGDRVSLRAPPEIDTDGGPTQDEEQAPQTPPAVAVL